MDRLAITRADVSFWDRFVCFFVLSAYVVEGGVNAACATVRARFDVVDTLFDAPRLGVNCDTVALAEDRIMLERRAEEVLSQEEHPLIFLQTSIGMSRWILNLWQQQAAA